MIDENIDNNDDENGALVGEQLKAARMALNLDIATVAGYLCINSNVIELIESGQYDGQSITYTIGHLRNYARYLNLDHDAIVNKYKEEKQVKQSNKIITIPETAASSSISPSTFLLIISLLGFLAVGVYYYQNYLSKSDIDNSPTPIVQSDDQDNKSTISTGNMPIDEAKVTVAEEQVTPAATLASDETTAPPPVPPAVLVSEAPVSPTAITPVQVPAIPVPKPVPPATFAPQEAPVIMPVSDKAALSETITLPPAGDEVVPATVQATEPVQTMEVVKEIDQQIVLKAIRETWIDITSPSGLTVFSRILNIGESFTLPRNDWGSVMVTGNAGGLEIMVGSVNIGTFGSEGEVRRSIVLTPEKLLSLR